MRRRFAGAAESEGGVTLRDVPVFAPGAEVPPQAGKRGTFELVAIDKLRIDTRYQRDLGEKGRARVRDIALNFDWRRFTPIVCARAGDLFAIIDGQHRASAALTRGDIKQLPAWIVEADSIDQAKAFIAINAKASQVYGPVLWYSRAAAGDADAKAMFALCAKAGIEICRHPTAANFRKSNQTLAPAAIDRARRTHGDGPVLRALDVLRRAGELHGQALITQRMIQVGVVLAKLDWSKGDPSSIALGFRNFKVTEAEAKARVAAMSGGKPIDHLIEITRKHLARNGGRLAA